MLASTLGQGGYSGQGHCIPPKLAEWPLSSPGAALRAPSAQLQARGQEGQAGPPRGDGRPGLSGGGTRSPPWGQLRKPRVEEGALGEYTAPGTLGPLWGTDGARPSSAWEP